LTPDFLSVAGTGAVNSYGSNEGLDLAGASQAFRNAYHRRFHAHLQFYDALAYDAANIALNAIYQASRRGKLHGRLFQMRAAILSYVAHVRWHGAAGVTTFDQNGDTRNRVVSMYAVQKGKWRFEGKAPKVKGVSPTG
jgi:branched-chain amino acid transport system substrate-binding protein